MQIFTPQVQARSEFFFSFFRLCTLDLFSPTHLSSAYPFYFSLYLLVIVAGRPTFRLCIDGQKGPFSSTVATVRYCSYFRVDRYYARRVIFYDTPRVPLVDFGAWDFEPRALAIDREFAIGGRRRLACLW